MERLARILLFILLINSSGAWANGNAVPVNSKLGNLTESEHGFLSGFLPEASHDTLLKYIRYRDLVKTVQALEQVFATNGENPAVYECSSSKTTLNREKDKTDVEVASEKLSSIRMHLAFDSTAIKLRHAIGRQNMMKVNAFLNVSDSTQRFVEFGTHSTVVGN